MGVSPRDPKAVERDEELRLERRERFASQMDSEAVMQASRLRGLDRDLTEDEESDLDKKVRLVAAVARSLGRDFNLKVEPGEAWAYNLETNTLTMPLLEVLQTEPNVCVALAIHEAGHRQITQVVDRSFYTRESKRLLLNAVEDPRVNDWMIREYRGVERNFMTPLYDRLFPTDETSPLLEAFERNLPHVQYVYGLIHHWAHGNEQPAITNENVLEALRETRPAVQRAIRTLPEGMPPNQQQLYTAAQQTTDVVREEIWPVYEKLVKRSIGILEEGLRDGSIKLGSDGQRSGLSASELPEEARRLVERASGKLATALGGKIERPDSDDLDELGEEEEPLPGDGIETELSSGPDSPGGKDGGAGVVSEKGAGKSATPVAVVRTATEEERAAGLRTAKRLTHERAPYSKYLDEVAPLVEELAGTLESILEPDSAPKKTGFYRSGTSISVPRLMQRRGSGSPVRDVFLRRARPSARDYRFSLVLDESGSMREGRKDFNAICATVLFTEVLERLKIPFEIAGFHSNQIVHKQYQDALTAQAKDKLADEIHRSMGGGSTHDVRAVDEAVDRIGEASGTERFILVITDGEGNGPGKMPEAIARAEREETRIVGVGVGEGVDHVARQYPEYVQVRRVQELPSALAGKIEELLLTN